MTLLSSVHSRPRAWRRKRRHHLVPVLLGVGFAVAAAALIAWLLWPTWHSGAASSPDRIPVSVGATLFNVPTHAFRRKMQKHSGAQERLDLSYNYPSLEAPVAPKHVSLETFDENAQPIDRIFLSIEAHHDALSPEQRLRTIYPRYFDQTASSAEDGLTLRPSHENSAYSNEDLFVATAPDLAARCTRDGVTPGMCLSERRVGGADLTFRFPRDWLAQWRDVALAMDRLTAQLSSPRG
ncbi:hypothetical protein BH11PSE4_BH11PSE4_09900 [soil metagenome]